MERVNWWRSSPRCEHSGFGSSEKVGLTVAWPSIALTRPGLVRLAQLVALYADRELRLPRDASGFTSTTTSLDVPSHRSWSHHRLPLSCGGPDWVRIVSLWFSRHGGPRLRLAMPGVRGGSTE